jgi:hypothetical protein
MLVCWAFVEHEICFSKQVDSQDSHRAIAWSYSVFDDMIK